MDILLLRKMNGAGEHKSTHPSELDRLPLYSKFGVDPLSITRRLYSNTKTNVFSMPFFAGFVNVESLLDVCCESVDFCEFRSKDNGFSAAKYFDAPV